MPPPVIVSLQVQAVRNNYVLQFQFEEVQLKLLPWPNFAQFSGMVPIALYDTLVYKKHPSLPRHTGY